MLGQTIARGEDGAYAHPPRFMRRDEAASYLKATYGFGAFKTLAKGVCTGDTPAYHKAGRLVVYTREALDTWALAKLGAPIKPSPKAAAA